MEGFADADGASLFYEDWGRGSPVVLLHPGLWDSRVWDPQMRAFARNHRVVRYDMRGYGRSDGVTGPYSNVDDLRRLLDALGIDRAALVGCSRGGRVAIDFTLEHPERVSALIPVASALSGWEPPPGQPQSVPWDEVEAALEQAIEAGELERAVELELEVWAPLGTEDEAGSRIREIALENAATETLDASLERRPDPPAATRLAEIAVPALVILGADDVPEMNTVGRFIAENAPAAELVVLDGADHVVNMRQPEEFNRVVLDFLAPVGV